MSPAEHEKMWQDAVRWAKTPDPPEVRWAMEKAWLEELRRSTIQHQKELRERLPR